MANTKISALTLGDPALTADEVPVNRSGVNKKITIGSIFTTALSQANAAIATAIAALNLNQVQQTVRSFSATGTDDLTGIVNLTVHVTAGSSGVSRTLPAAAGHTGQRIKYFKIDTGIGAVTPQPGGSDLLLGDNVGPIINQWQFIEFESNGTSWISCGGN